MINNWDDITTKDSHPNKPLRKHLEEVETIFNIFAKYYEIQNWAIDLMLPVVRSHDYGKLNPAWSICNHKNPPHSEYSIQYIKEKKLFEKLKEQQPNLYPLILYLILKHHSALYDRSSCKDELLKRLCTDLIRMIVTKLPIDKRIEIVDAFGMFKLADALSASNKATYLPQQPHITLNLVQKILSSKKGYVDDIRWIEQQKLIHLSDTALLTAYAGWGKTDSSLLYCTNQNVKKIFYLFPMITAINKFYDKLSSFIQNGVEKYFYLYEYEIATKNGESLDESNEFNISSFTASHFLNPIILTTVDQFLLAFLQLGKYYMKRVMFRSAAIIVDEVHLLNPKMLALLLRFAQKLLPIYKFRILFMSATFSDALMQVIKDYLPHIDITDLSKGYEELLRINYDLSNISKTILEDVEKIEKYVKSGKVLVVANTVETAVSLFRRLELHCEKQRSLSYPLLLLHGKFMYKDRKLKENKIDDLKDRPHILVTTQVCEVSLDASYNVLFTEIAPLPSLIQRFGRVNRYGRRTNLTNVFIYKENRKEDSNKYHYPYEEEDINVAKQILEEINPLRSEYDLIKKYNEVERYDVLSKRINETEKEIDFENSWEKDDSRTAYFFSFKLNEEELRKRLLEFRESITVNILPDPVCINDEDTKSELEKILDKWNKRSTVSREGINLILKTIRGYLVPIPLWLAAKYTTKQDSVLPLMNPDNLIYYGRYGFIEKNNR